ncbi:unnamed protein product [Ilex paraguariensis]|uniref:Uncharacterized protein n=1 Tax=Ilex paraguariensis TaxID=185542 RepID=A0ABC8TWA2_9AQUA
MQSNVRVEEVCVSIREKLNGPSPSQSKCCMFRVHGELRNVNKTAYEPKIIAIGPYHRSTITLQATNKYKLHYFQLLLEQKKEITVEKYVDAMRLLEEDTRKCYGEPIGVNENELVEMMILDGCFIIELIRKFVDSSLRDEHDPIFPMDWIVNSLQRDLMLFENQLPFFVLRKLFYMIDAKPDDSRFINLALDFFRDLLPVHRKSIEGSSPENAKHLLGLIHSYWLPSFAGNVTSEKFPANNNNWQSIHCATELREAGIQFVKNEECSLFDIKFENGVIHMLPLIIEDRTETLFRNLIAYEQYGKDEDFKYYVTNYVEFLDNLIDSSNDVGILCRRRIIENGLGDDEVVSNIFNKITDAVTRTNNDFHYAEIFAKVNIHCNKRRNRWIAKLRRNYLNSPWGFISIAAGFILLLLTFTQTFFTVVPKWALD